MVAALHAGRLGGAFWDVWPQEPADPGDPRLRAPGLVVTPHAAWHSARADQAYRDEAVAVLRDVLAQRVLSASSTASIAAGSPTVMRSRSGRSWSSSDRTRIPCRARCDGERGRVVDDGADEVRVRRQVADAERVEPGLQARPVCAVALAAAGDLGLVVDAGQRGGDRRVGDVVVVPGRDEPRGHPGGAGEPADPQAGEPVHLREGPQRADVRARADVLGDGVGMVRPGGELPVGLVDDDEHVLGHGVEERRELLAPDRRAGRVVRRADPDEPRARRDRRPQGVEVDGAVGAQRREHRRGAGLLRVADVRRERRPAR